MKMFVAPMQTLACALKTDLSGVNRLLPRFIALALQFASQVSHLFEPIPMPESEVTGWL
jgi:hypothetical protein